MQEKTIKQEPMKYHVQDAAAKSIGHRQEKEFLEWLADARCAVIDLEDDDPRWNWGVQQWRTALIQEDAAISDSELEALDEQLVELFSDVGEVIASIGYDHYGMGHSGWNGVYEFSGLYKLSGSDYGGGPQTELAPLLRFLKTENPEHDVYWSEAAGPEPSWLSCLHAQEEFEKKNA
jgi:hypothetical protein